MALSFNFLNFCQVWLAITGEDFIFIKKTKITLYKFQLAFRISKQNWKIYFRSLQITLQSSIYILLIFALCDAMVTMATIGYSAW